MKLRRGVVSTLVVFLAVLPFAPTARTQVGPGGARVSVYHWPDYVKQPPLEVAEMKVAGQRVVSGRSFSPTDAWLKSFTVTVRNVSQKNVKYLRVRIEFPRDSKRNSILNDILLTSGQMFHFSPEISRTGEDVTLAPLGTIDLALSDEAFAGLQAEIASKGLTKKVADFAIISVDMVLFDDNTGWISGNPVVRDKDNPSRWVREKSAEAQMISRLREFLGARSRRLFGHRVEEASCYRFDSASSASCGGPSCFTVVYNLSTASSGFNTKSRSESCSCGGTTTTTDTDTNSTCGLAD